MDTDNLRRLDIAFSIADYVRNNQFEFALMNIEKLREEYHALGNNYAVDKCNTLIRKYASKLESESIWN